MYEFTSGKLNGSFDSRISFSIKRERLMDDTKHHLRTGKKTMVMTPCKPFIRLECSIHKALLGHNVYGGTDDLLGSTRWLMDFLQKQIGCYHLPRFYSWEVYRLDFAKPFNLGTFEAVEEWIRSMKHCSFPRRKGGTYGDESFYFSGRNTIIKCYHKGPEFYTHDRKRLLTFMKPSEVNKLQEFANTILRVEVGIRSKQLKEDFGHVPQVWEITREYMEKIYSREVSKLIRESKHESKIYRSAEAVQKRLYDLYSSQQAGMLLGTWYQLATLGEKPVKGKMKKSTFYYHRKLLVDSGCSWLQTDVILREFSSIPFGFVPMHYDERCISKVHEIVKNKLSRVA